MIKYWFCILLLGACQSQAQDLTQIVHYINPALYLNNMDNEPVYHQSIMSKHCLLFTRLYGQRDNELKEQSFYYVFLNAKRRNWIMEIRLDQHDFKVSQGQEMQAIRSSDFGFKVYNLQGEVWVERTAEVFPENFVARFEEQFPDLQRSSWGYYYYNQNPECVIEPNLHRRVLHFEQNGKKALCLAWYNNHFVWK